jgi:formate--tetrahydrofolate ligase
MKGGAAGGGYAQVVPMEDINLHFTGDFSAIALAHNLLAALVDNHIHHGNALGLDTAAHRLAPGHGHERPGAALDGGRARWAGQWRGHARMASTSSWRPRSWRSSAWPHPGSDLKQRLANGSWSATPATRNRCAPPDLQAQGAMAALLKDAIKPNLVQTLENNPAIIHGGPFANIAHGCNTVTATRAALKLADYVVTEAGFGADLGAEKFIDIKCRKSGLRPDCAVVVATVRALKHHGGVDAKALNQPDPAALERGLPNLERHVHNIREHYGLPCVVSINHFTSDSPEEIDLLRSHMERRGVPVVLARHWAEGSAGAEELARAVVQLVESGTAQMRYVYPDEQTLWEKMRTIATRIYGAADIDASSAVRARIEQLQQEGYGHYPVCVAKTQYSFSTDPKLRAAPSGHVVQVREVRLAAGAEFVVMVCGDIMTMPGLPREPASSRIDIDDDGRISGLF